MTRQGAALAMLLSFAILTLWVESRWAWSLVQVAVFIAVAVWATEQLRRPSAIRGRIWLAPLCAAPLWGLVQLAANRTVYRWGTWNATLNWVTWLAFFFLALQLFQHSRARHVFLDFALYFGFGLSVLSTLQVFTSAGKYFWLFNSGYQDYVMGPFANRNHYAAFMETILPIALWQAVRGRRVVLAHCAMGAAIVASVVASASRAGSILVCSEVAVVLLAAWLQGLAPGRRVAQALGVFSALTVLFIALGGWQALSQRLWEPDPLAGRREFLISSLAMIQDRPAMGVGLGDWSRAYPHYAIFDDGTFANQAHNDWLQWAVEGGWPFFALLFSLALMALPSAFRSVWGIGLIAFWLHCLVEYPLQQRPGLAAWFFVLLAVLAASKHGKSSQGHRRWHRGEQSEETQKLLRPALESRNRNPGRVHSLQQCLHPSSDKTFC